MVAKRPEDERLPTFRAKQRLGALVATVVLLLCWLALSTSTAAASAAVLVGDATTAPSTDTDGSGLAEAFKTTASASGSADALNVFLDGSSKATRVVVGLYADKGGHPGALLVQGAIATPATGAWNSVSVAATPVTAGTAYWIAILGTGGTLAFRDRCCGGGAAAENSAQGSLSSLPTTWSSGAKWSDGPASLYASTGAPPPPPPPPDVDKVGQWSPLMDWGFVAAHSILMHSGKLLEMDGWVAPNPSQLFDPSNGSLSIVTNPFGLDIFCSGHATLPDGRVVIAGGHGFDGEIGINNTSIFDPATNAWTAGPKMSFARWYPTVTELGDGRLVAISGNVTASTWADKPEIYDATKNAWTTIPGISTSQVHEEEYPLSYLLPSGKVFTIASSTASSYLLDPDAPSWTPVGGTTLATDNGSAVMYRPGKILYSGGGTPLNSTSPAKSAAQVIDFGDATPTWKPTASMKAARYAHTLTMLPDGKVLAVGGGTNLDQENVAGGERSTEEWDPATGTWTALAPADAPRVYHSTSVLLPDGRVLVAGGGNAESTGSPGERNAQFYSPPYLFQGARPTITSAPTSATYGSSINVATPDASSIASVSLVSLGADTHTIDMNQHFVPLSFTRDSSSLSVDLPSSASLAPPGYYMLFVVNAAGVPSVAPFIQVTRDETPPTVTMTAPAAGTVSGSVTLSAIASAPTGISSVQFTVDGAAVGPKRTSAPYTMSLDTTTLANGPHKLGATAVSGAGVSGDATPVTVTVSNAGPAIPVVDARSSTEAKGTVTTGPLSTTHAGDVLVAFATSDGPGSGGQTVTVSGAGLTWSLVKRVNAQLGDTEIWTAKAAGPLAGASVTSTPAKAGYNQSLTVLAFSGASRVGASATASARSGAPSVSLATTAAGSVVYGDGNDYDRAVARTPGSGQALVHEWLDSGFGDSYWVQNRTASTATAGSTATINDTAPTGDRWNLAAVEVVPG
jgi:Galactose oxidase-like, Early set domain/Bacterial Ig domain